MAKKKLNLELFPPCASMIVKHILTATIQNDFLYLSLPA